jgi:hypothetical protein
MSAEEKGLEFVIAVPQAESSAVETERFFHFDVYRDSGDSELPSTDIELACPSPFKVDVVGATSHKHLSPNVVTDSFEVRLRPASPQFPLEDGQGFVTSSVKGRGGWALSVPIRWIIRYPVSITPKPIFFGIYTKENQAKSQTMRLHSEDDCAFRVLNVRTESQGLQFGWDSDPSRSAHEITCILNSTNIAAGAIKGTITLELDHPAVARVVVPWSALVLRRQ